MNIFINHFGEFSVKKLKSIWFTYNFLFRFLWSLFWFVNLSADVFRVLQQLRAYIYILNNWTALPFKKTFNVKKGFVSLRYILVFCFAFKIFRSVIIFFLCFCE